MTTTARPRWKHTLQTLSARKQRRGNEVRRAAEGGNPFAVTTYGQWLTEMERLIVEEPNRARQLAAEAGINFEAARIDRIARAQTAAKEAARDALLEEQGYV